MFSNWWIACFVFNKLATKFGDDFICSGDGDIRSHGKQGVGD